LKLDDWLAKRAETSPDRLAIAAGGREVDYAGLERLAASAARRLAARGVRRGQTVALAMPAGLEFAVALHALSKLGAVALPLNMRLAPPEQKRILDQAKPFLVLDTDTELTGTEADMPLLGEHDTEETHCLVYTSGTSGHPKPVSLTYGNHLWSALGSGFNLGIDPADRWLCCLPLYHVGGLSILLRSALYGTAALVHDGFDTDRVAESLERDGVTIVSLVSTLLARLLEAGADVSGPRVILVGGGPVPRAVLEEAIARGATVVQSYGLTEAGSQVTTLAPADAVRKLGSSGRPLLPTRLRISDGEIMVAGPTVAPACLEDDGWLHTGDLGRIDEEGYLWVEGRADDLIVTGAENVSPAEVEAVLLDHPEVAEAAVIAREDAEWQRAVTALVVPREGATPSAEDLAAHCRESLAGYKVPKRFELVDELPRSVMGKLLRRALG
jgi:O-succinylbenzoic acid--CoA ligase